MSWSQIHAARRKHAKALEDGVSKWKDPALAERVLAHLASASEPPVSAELDVPAAALVGPKYWFEYHEGDKARWPHWIERWTRHDLAFAVRALFESTKLHVEDTQSAIFVAPEPEADGLGKLGPEPLVLVRKAIASASKADYARAKAAADELLRDAPLAVRFALAYLFPKEDFAKEHAGWALSTREEDYSTTSMLYTLAVAGDASSLDPALSTETCWEAWAELAHHLDELVKELGPRALPILRLMLLSSSWGEWQARSAEALVKLDPTVDVARVAAEFLEDHHAGAVLRPWLRAHPDLGIGAVAEHVAAALERDKRAKVPAAGSLLSSLVLANRTLAEAAAQKVSAPARAVLARALEETKPLPDAERDELPAPLARPPWREPPTKKAKVEAVVYPKLSPLPYEERVLWAEDETAEEIANAAFSLREEERSVANDAKVLRTLEAERKKDGYTFCFRLGNLTDAVALRILGEWGPDAFYYDQGDVIGIVARHGMGALGLAIRFAASKPDAVEGLERIDSPSVAPLMAHVAVNLKKKRDVGERWLARHAEAAAIGLIPALSERSGKERGTIEEALRLVARNAPDTVADVAKRYGAQKVIEAVLASSSFAKLPKKLPKMPKFWNAKGLPRPRLAGGDKALPLSAIEDLGIYLALGKREAYHPALFAIRAACDRPSLARFAWALFSEWLGAGAPTKDDFGFFVLGVFGDDAAAHALQPMIKAWAPGGFPTRAQMGVDVLAALGTHAALEEVYKTATKVRSRALATHAEKTLEKIAARLELSREDLADRLVPDLDLDERGSRVFDYGKRKFVVRFDEHFKPYVDLGGGKRAADLPKPTDADDENAAGAFAAFKEMKKRAREVAAEQGKRLEHALVTRRKYDRKTFEERFVDHALLRMLGARLVWGAYHGQRLRGAFRIEDGSFVDEGGRPFELRDDETVGLLHPAEITAAARARWGDVLAEHRIIQPIVQLGRQVFEPSGDLLAGARNKKVPTTKVLGLERRFWKRDASGQGGVVSAYEKPLGELRAVLTLDPGVYLGDPKEHSEQTIEACTLSRAGKAASLADLDVAMASELLADLASLTQQ